MGRKIVKWALFLLSFTIISFCVFNCKSVVYGLRQGVGQVKVITNTTPISELLADKSYPDSLKVKIRLIQKVKQFTVDSLGLNPSGSYDKLYNQRGEPLIWMMTAAKPFELTPYEWHFPIVGTFTYKGHFKKQLAIDELEQLKKEGYDTRLGGVAAWSTLGYLNDPILSEMLNRNTGELVALIIHELTHGTLYIKNDVEFNENLADFIGDYGAIRFLKSTFGENSNELKTYLQDLESNELYSDYLLKSTKKLDSLYRVPSFQSATNDVKEELKEALILDIMLGRDTLDLKNKKGEAYWKNNLPNNAYFCLFLNYQAKQNEFKNEFETKFKSNFNTYFAFLKKKYGKKSLLKQ